jgi:hypothetical protein
MDDSSSAFPIPYCPSRYGKCIYPAESIEPRRQCFIIMSYAGEFSRSVEAMLRAAVYMAYGAQLKPILASDLAPDGRNQLLCHRICSQIKSSELCLADLTYESISVGFEAALAEIMGKSTTYTMHPNWRAKHLNRLGKGNRLSDGPADLADRYVITYEDACELAAKLKGLDSSSRFCN